MEKREFWIVLFVLFAFVLFSPFLDNSLDGMFGMKTIGGKQGPGVSTNLIGTGGIVGGQGPSFQNLLLWFKFENSLLDYSNSGNSYNIYWDPITGTYVDGKVGKAMWQDGNANTPHVVIKPHQALGGMNDLTVLFWAKKNNANPVYGRVVNKHGSYRLGVWEDEIKLYIWNSDGDGTQFSIDVPEINDKEWHHYALTTEGDFILIYVDGDLVGNPVSFPYSIGIAGNNLVLGKNEWSGEETFDGAIDEVLIYDRVLSESEIEDLIDDGGDKDRIECRDGQRKLCSKQDGVCLGSFETCVGKKWPGCDDTTYYNWNNNYENPEISCGDGLDNDCDDKIDMDDEDCQGPPSGDEHIYIANESLGSNNGSNCENAHGKEWFNDAGNWSGNYDLNDGLIGPGDTVHLCGEFTFPVREIGLTVQGSGTQGNPITILFEEDAKLSSPCFEADPNGPNGGAIYIENKNYIIIDGDNTGIIENTETGTNLPYYRINITERTITGSAGIHIQDSSNIDVKNMKIINMYVPDPNFIPPSHPERRGQVPKDTYTAPIIFRDSNYLSIYNNTFEVGGLGIWLGLANNTGIDIHHNSFTGFGVAIFGGTWTYKEGDNLLMHHNIITDTTGWGYNDGIKLFAPGGYYTEITKGVKIYNNIIGPKISYPQHPATAWILVNQGYFESPEIFNNLFIGDESDLAPEGFISIGGLHTAYGGDKYEMNSKIYGNTFISNYPTYTTARGITLNYNTTGHQIFNNIFRFNDTSSYIIVIAHDSEIGECDYNLFHTEGVLSNECTEPNNIIADPLLDAAYRISTEISPAVDTGRDLDLEFAFDLDDNIRPIGDGWDRGAYEYTG